VLRAMNPWYAVEFFVHDRLEGFLILGAVVLVITGGEALYADMGHFGKRPIRRAWFLVALPALLLNYFGQAALLIETPGVSNPFFALAPTWLLYPLIGVATLAAIVASQALISGAFSLTRQAVQLGYSPRVTIVHTSRTEVGQIYAPEVNQGLAIACILLVLGYGSSTELAAAYGIAVTGTMIITTLLFYQVARTRWGWRLLPAGGVCALFLLVDLAFFGANLTKFADGGWFPIAVGVAVYTLMSTWKRGRSRLTALAEASSLPIDLLLADLGASGIARVPGTAVFLTSAVDVAPPVLLHHLKHNRALHQRVLLLSLVTEAVPQVSAEERIESRALGEGFWRVVGHYGFMETPDVPALMALLGQLEGPEAPGGIFLTQTSFYLGRDTLVAAAPSPRPRRARDASAPLTAWRRRLFIAMSRNAQSATSFFGLPPNRVVELGAQIQI
ncbi:MAG TPA: KUP/HAK/KT family potassium transporter, partial [Gemmatimonadales bacterium]|nr:KUP/HAK/KT family potassium transporter [Gemmatimonadales bacterium]